MADRYIISVIIPCFNAERSLFLCLDSLRGLLSSEEDEVIVVDDHSTDQSGRIALQYKNKLPNLQVLKNDINLGAAATRNRGAHVAQGGILLFLDADVTVMNPFREKLLETFKNNRDLAAIQGIYDAYTPISSFASQYKNLFYHFQYLNIKGDEVDFSSTFFLAVRRKSFISGGCFNEKIQRASVEDGELAFDLISQGYRILLDRSLRVRHLADYSLFQLLRRSFLNAAQKAESLKRKSRQIRLNHNRTEHPVNILASILIGGSASLLLLFTSFYPRVIVAVLCLVLFFFALNMKQLLFVFQGKNLKFLLRYAFLLYCDLTASFYGLIFGVLTK